MTQITTVLPAFEVERWERGEGFAHEWHLEPASPEVHRPVRCTRCERSYEAIMADPRPTFCARRS